MIVHNCVLYILSFLVYLPKSVVGDLGGVDGLFGDDPPGEQVDEQAWECGAANGEHNVGQSHERGVEPEKFGNTTAHAGNLAVAHRQIEFLFHIQFN